LGLAGHTPLFQLPPASRRSEFESLECFSCLAESLATESFFIRCEAERKILKDSIASAHAVPVFHLKKYALWMYVVGVAMCDREDQKDRPCG
jgi:hypothetical protein